MRSREKSNVIFGEIQSFKSQSRDKDQGHALADDLDAPRVLRALEQWCSETESGSHGGEAGELARALDLYLGIAI